MERISRKKVVFSTLQMKWWTLLSVSTDEQLKDKFGMPLGLASTKTWDEVIAFLNKDQGNSSQIKLPILVEKNDVFIRILDPATGTGTFMKLSWNRFETI